MDKVFCVYDSKAETYLTPFVMRSRGEAIRGFSDVTNDPNTQFAKHPGDFTLFEIGEWDSDSAKIAMYEAKQNLGVAIEFRKQEREIQERNN